MNLTEKWVEHKINKFNKKKFTFTFFIFTFRRVRVEQRYLTNCELFLPD